MKKKIVALMLAGALSISAIACGGSDTPDSPQQSTNQEDNKDNSNDSIEVEKELFDVNITLPADLAADVTQESLDEEARELGYKVVLNEDGSVTYTMTKSQHKKFLENYKEELNTELQSMIGSEDYPNYTAISANDNFTDFTITTVSNTLDLNEGFSVLIFYMTGTLYNIFSGEEIDNVHVDFVNADSGEIISSSDSKDMGDWEDWGNLEEEDNDTEDVSSAVNLEDGIIDFEGEGYHITYLKHEVSTDYDGEPCLLYYFTFTNNSEENSSADMTTYIQCFQNGIECDTTFISDDNKETSNYTKDIQPGISIDVCTVFALEDNSEVTLEASDWFSFSDRKDIQKISLE